MSRDYDATARPEIQATVHWCPANASHRLHVVVGARRGPGWYVFIVKGCRGNVLGPFENEQSATYAANAVEHHRLNSRRALG